jgi:hypothetical protein
LIRTAWFPVEANSIEDVVWVISTLSTIHFPEGADLSSKEKDIVEDVREGRKPILTLIVNIYFSIPF